MKQFRTCDPLTTSSHPERLFIAVLAAFSIFDVGCSSSSNDAVIADAGGSDSATVATPDVVESGSEAAADVPFMHRLNDTFTTPDVLGGYEFSDYPDMMTLNLKGNYVVEGGASSGEAAAADATGADDAAAADASGEAGSPAAVAEGGSGEGGSAPPSGPKIEWDGTDGSPDLGALKVTVTYTGYRQYVDLIRLITPAIDLKNRTLKAQVKLVSSTPAAFTGGIQFHASAGPSYTYFGNPGLSFGPVGTWSPIALDLGPGSASFDSGNIVQVGVQVYSGDPPMGAGTLANPITVVFEIDTVTD